MHAWRSWLQAEWGSKPGVMFRWLKEEGVGVRLDPKRGTGPVLQERFVRGATILRQVGCLPTFCMREVAIGTLALAKAMYRVELADVGSRDVARLERRSAPSGDPHAPHGRRRCYGRSWCRGTDLGSTLAAPPLALPRRTPSLGAAQGLATGGADPGLRQML